MAVPPDRTRRSRPRRPRAANTARNWLSVSSWSKGVDGIVNLPGCEEQKCKCPDHGRLRSRQVYSWRALGEIPCDKIQHMGKARENRRALLLAFFLAQAMWSATDDASFARLVQQIGSGVEPDHAMQTMRRVWETDRWFTFPKFRETAEYLRAAMTAAGLRDVELLEAPADGASRAGYWTMPLAWDVKQAQLEIVAPAPSPEFRLLADYQTTPTSLGMWSGPTAPDGVIAEVVELQRSSDLERLDVKGKLVLTAENPRVSNGCSLARARSAQLMPSRRFGPARRPPMDQRMGRQRMGFHQGQRAAALFLD